MVDERKNEFRTVRGYELQKKNVQEITPSMEDYLEMIYRIKMEERTVTVSMVSEKLQVKPSSVSKMNRKLIEMGLLLNSTADGLMLTEQGSKRAEYFLYRHDVLVRFLTLIGSKEPLLETELAEHHFSVDTVHKIHYLVAFLEKEEDFLWGDQKLDGE